MYEYLVGLAVSDNAVYAQYRAAMKPILSLYHGGFGYDLVVSEVLRSETNEPINRVFTIHFPSKEASERFFSDEDYLQVKARYFDASVAHTTIIAGYDRPA
ncbi:DUF1330 domain-containing protein [Pseudoalteromonas rubra]|uniref:DUF1330 domain-containing protein n=1 Tax=Pseudoalteromonas rubra TaxID=43658 RepID=A0A5S3UQI5_9GAMM|nr:MULTISPECIES: DUF1330 domain-containing protein [Pseudoalteromonas]QPB83688.1 DUF1330 domain-containing protein [Pseudoalteromonas rubra]